MERNLESPRLPDEILVKIIRECIESYELTIHQQVYSYVKVQTYLEGLKRDYDDILLLEMLKVTYWPADGVSLDTGTLVVKGFTTPKDFEYLRGLPQVTDLKLVNQLFYKEIVSLLALKFTGRLCIEGVREFTLDVHIKDWKSQRQPPGIGSFSWLYPIITEISYYDNNGLPAPPLHIIQSGMTPNLQKLVIYAGGELCPGGRREDVLEGVHDELAVDVVKFRQHRFIDWWFTLGATTRDNVQLFFNVDLSLVPLEWADVLPRADDPDDPTTPKYPWHSFTIELNVERVCVVIKRE